MHVDVEIEMKEMRERAAQKQRDKYVLGAAVSAAGSLRVKTAPLQLGEKWRSVCEDAPLQN